MEPWEPQYRRGNLSAAAARARGTSAYVKFLGFGSKKNEYEEEKGLGFFGTIAAAILAPILLNKIMRAAKRGDVQSMRRFQDQIRAGNVEGSSADLAKLDAALDKRIQASIRRKAGF